MKKLLPLAFLFVLFACSKDDETNYLTDINSVKKCLMSSTWFLYSQAEDYPYAEWDDAYMYLKKNVDGEKGVGYPYGIAFHNGTLCYLSYHYDDNHSENDGIPNKVEEYWRIEKLTEKEFIMSHETMVTLKFKRVR